MTKSRNVGRGGARPGAGRKRKEPPAATTDVRILVEQMLAAGESREVIARALGCTLAELEQRFADALEHGHARRRAEAVDLLFRGARAGNPALLKALLEMTGAAGAEKSFLDAADPPVRRRPLGKKEHALKEAQSAGEGTEWGEDLVPGAPWKH